METETMKAEVKTSEGGDIFVDFDLLDANGNVLSEQRDINSDLDFETLCSELRNKYSDYRHFYDDDDINKLTIGYRQAVRNPVNLTQNTTEPKPDLEIVGEPEEEEDLPDLANRLDSEFGQFDSEINTGETFRELPPGITSRDELPQNFKEKVFSGKVADDYSTSMQLLQNEYLGWVQIQLQKNFLIKYVLDGLNFTELWQIFRKEAPKIFGRKRFKNNMFKLYCEARRIGTVLEYVNLITSFENPMMSAAIRLHSIGYTDLLTVLRTEQRILQERGKIEDGTNQI